jgi:hypothetical protein
MGDYVSTGSGPANSTTTTAAVAAGATAVTLTTATDYTAGGAIQIGTTPVTETAIIASVSTDTLTLSTPLRFAHASGAAVSVVTAPFTHTFSLLNSTPGQPPTHTLSFYQGLTGDVGVAQYPYWCCSGCSFSMDAEKLFMHETKGMSYIRQAGAGSFTNSYSDVPVYANWQFAVGIGGPASGATQVNDVTEMSLDIGRQLKQYFTASGQQAPYVIARNALTVEGKFTEVAQNENPMLELLDNTQPPIQLAATNGKTGADLLAITFNMQVAAYETVKLNSNDVIEYESSFKAVANPTNAGASGGQSPLSVVIQNAVVTY